MCATRAGPLPCLAGDGDPDAGPGGGTGVFVSPAMRAAMSQPGGAPAHDAKRRCARRGSSGSSLRGAGCRRASLDLAGSSELRHLPGRRHSFTVVHGAAAASFAAAGGALLARAASGALPSRAASGALSELSELAQLAQLEVQDSLASAMSDDTVLAALGTPVADGLADDLQLAQLQLQLHQLQQQQQLQQAQQQAVREQLAAAAGAPPALLRANNAAPALGGLGCALLPQLGQELGGSVACLASASSADGAHLLALDQHIEAQLHSLLQLRGEVAATRAAAAMSAAPLLCQAEMLAPGGAVGLRLPAQLL